MLEIRVATPEDADVITDQRRDMFLDMGKHDPERIAPMSQQFKPWVKDRLAEGAYLGWLAVEGNRVVAGLGCLLLDWPPHFLDPLQGQRAYLLNLYVDPAHRRQGLAGRLIDVALAEAARRRIRVTALHASEAGKPLYESKGFSLSNEMLFVAPDSPGQE